MRPFTDVLRDIRKGRVVDYASEQLAEVVGAVLEHGKPGTLTVTLKIKAHGRGDNAVSVDCEVKAKSPQADLPTALFFADQDGSLLRDDPTQTRMFAEAGGEPVDRETGEILTAGRA